MPESWQRRSLRGVAVARRLLGTALSELKHRERPACPEAIPAPAVPLTHAPLSCGAQTKAARIYLFFFPRVRKLYFFQPYFNHVRQLRAPRFLQASKILRSRANNGES